MRETHEYVQLIRVELSFLKKELEFSIWVLDLSSRALFVAMLLIELYELILLSVLKRLVCILAWVRSVVSILVLPK